MFRRVGSKNIAPTIDDLEASSSFGSGKLNKLGYRSMSPEEAVEQANIRVAAMGIETVVDYEYNDEEREQQQNLVSEMEGMFDPLNPIAQQLMDAENEKREERRNKIREEGFKIKPFV